MASGSAGLKREPSARSVFSGQKTRKEVEREKHKAKLGVCRVRKLLKDGGGYQTVGSGCVINNLMDQWPWKDKCCLVTTDKVIPKEHFDIEKFDLEFMKVNSTIRTFKLGRFAESDDVQWSTSGLVVIPLQDPTKIGKSPSIFTYRPFSKGDKPSNELFCPIVDDTNASSFDVKPFTLKLDQSQFVLHDAQSSFKSLAIFTGSSNRKPHGAVILSRESLNAVGILSCSEDGRIAPVWLSHENLSSLRPSSLKIPNQQSPVEQQKTVEESPYPDLNAPSAQVPIASTEETDTVISSKESAQNGKKPRSISQSSPDDQSQSKDRVKIPKVESSAGHHPAAEKTEADCKTPSELLLQPDEVTSEKGAVASSKEFLEDVKTLKSFPESHPGSGSPVRIKITPTNLDDQQNRKWKELLMTLITLYVESHDDLISEKGWNDFLNYVRKTHGVLIETLALGCLEIKVQCPTLNSLESLWSDYCSGHLNDVAERFLVTDKMLMELEVETVTLKTVITEEDYLACKKFLLETSYAAGSSSLQMEPEGASAILTPEFWKERSRDVSWKTRAEGAKKSRGALHKAAINGQCETVKALLENGEDVDQIDKFSLTPLHLAAWYGRESVVQLLLQHGAYVNAVDRFQRTAVQKAERHNHRSIVRLLLKNNATPSYRQPLSLRSLSRKAFLHVDRRSGFNLLQAAVVEGKYDTVWKAHGLLSNYVKEMNLEKTASNAKCFPEKTAVGILLSLSEKEKGHVDIENLYKEDVEKHNSLTELHLCHCSDDTEEAVELVLNEGVDINISAKSNRTPLLWASLSSSSQYIKTLIYLGADVNVQRTDDKVAPVYLAAYWNNYMATRVLLEYGADVNVQDKEGKAPLHDCARQGFFTISRLLIESGCNVNLRNNTDKTPLYVAVENKHVLLVQFLLQSKADVNMRYMQDPRERLYLVRGKDKGRPVWHYVMVEKPLFGLFLKRSKGGSLNVANFGTILKSGWGKDPPDRIREEMTKKGDSFDKIRGSTILHVASRNTDAEIVDLLVKHGVQVNGRDAEGYTPLHIAAIHGQVQIVRTLLELGADDSLTSLDGMDAAYLAELNEQTEIEEFLKSNERRSGRMVSVLKETLEWKTVDTDSQKFITEASGYRIMTDGKSYF